MKHVVFTTLLNPSNSRCNQAVPAAGSTEKSAGAKPNFVIQVFWDVLLCRLVRSDWCLEAF
jgi:hypothetical protein